MADGEHDHRIFDPNAPERADEAKPAEVVRRPQDVLGEFLTTLLHKLGNPADLEALAQELLALAEPPEIAATPSTIITE